MLILVIESSTTSSKAMLYDSERGVVGLVSETYSSNCLDDDIGLQNAEAVLSQTLLTACKIAKGKKIDAVVPCSTWHNVLVCDKDMNPTTSALTWTYDGAAMEVAGLRKSTKFTTDFYHRTGCMVHKIYPVFKLIHLQKQGLDLSDAFISSQGSYMFYKLTGCKLTSDCMTSGTGLLNIHSCTWDKQALEMVGIKENQLGEIVSYKSTRPLSKEGAALLGLTPGIPVLPAHPDGALNQVGSGALNPGIMTFSVGTSGALRLSTSAPILPKEPSTWCYLSPSGWISGAATSGACNCVDWIKHILFPKETSYEDIDKLNVDEENMPIFLPFLFGERCPGWNDSWKGGFDGLQPEHTPVDLYKSVQEGVIFNLYQCYQMLCKVNGIPKQIQLSGGILNSPFWRQMCCDIFGIELLCEDATHASMVGGAVLALEVLGKLDDIRNFKGKTTEKLLPNPERNKMFQKRFDQYLSLYHKQQ